MSNQGAERLGTAPLKQLVFSLALPALLAQLVNLLYGIVDRIYIGHMPDVGALALTGLGLCTPLILIISAFASFAGNGGAPLAAIELGRGNQKKAGEILSTSVALLVIFSLVISATIMAFREPLLYFFGASGDTIGYAGDYITIYLCGTIFVQLSLGLNTFISCQGQARTAMCSVLIGAVSNIILDPIFIFLFDMGVRGAALATVISQFFSAVWVLRFLFSPRSVLRFSLKEALHPHLKTIGLIFSLGISPFIMTSTESLIAIVFTSGLSHYGGDLYVGSYTVLNSVMQLMFVPVNSFSYGTQPIISYNYGAGKYDRIKENFKIDITVCGIYMLVFYICVLLFPRSIAGIFTSDRALLDICAAKLPIFTAGMVIFTIQLCAQVNFLGMGRAKVSLFLACLRKIILLTPLALILPRFLDVDGIYLAEPISDVISALAAGMLYARFSRRNYGLKREETQT